MGRASSGGRVVGGPRRRRRRFLGAPAASLLLVAVAARADVPVAAPAPTPTLAASALVAWKAASHSPQPGPAHEATLQSLCGAQDLALLEVAGRNARRQAEGSGLAGKDELAFLLRAAGNPNVLPRAWSIAGGAVTEDELARRVRAWLAPWAARGVRRCGIARAAGADGNPAIAIVAVDALADLAPLPTTARVGQWMSLEGTMLVAATAAKVVLLGPRGAPKTVVASLSGDRFRSTFAVDEPGEWLVQVVATGSTGPRPVLEVSIFAGTSPPGQFVRAPAPGEDAARGASDDADGLRRMINAARAAERLSPLTHDAELSKVAQAHAEEMRSARVVGHDLGTGDPVARLQAAGVVAHVTGENVASASTLENAHRALWASPSHRGNLLLGEYARVGVGVARSPDGTVWVTETFAD